jgi:hypothetical protein
MGVFERLKAGYNQGKIEAEIQQQERIQKKAQQKLKEEQEAQQNPSKAGVVAGKIAHSGRPLVNGMAKLGEGAVKIGKKVAKGSGSGGKYAQTHNISYDSGNGPNPCPITTERYEEPTPRPRAPPKRSKSRKTPKRRPQRRTSRQKPQSNSRSNEPFYFR